MHAIASSASPAALAFGVPVVQPGSPVDLPAGGRSQATVTIPAGAGVIPYIIAGNRRTWDKAAIPAVCFTDPEIVTAGLSLEEARAAGIDTKSARFPFQASGRAMTMEAAAGFVRVVARADNHLILGLQAVGAGVSELSAAFGLALEMGARLEDVAATIHAHPTLGEALQEAALRALGHAIHV